MAVGPASIAACCVQTIPLPPTRPPSDGDAESLPESPAPELPEPELPESLPPLETPLLLPLEPPPLVPPLLVSEPLLLPAPEPSDGDGPPSEPPPGVPPSSFDPQLYAAAVSSETQTGNARDAALQGIQHPSTGHATRPYGRIAQYCRLAGSPVVDVRAFRGRAPFAVSAALLGTVNAVDSPTRQAFVTEMVGRENLASAVAFNTTMVTGASFVGPAIAGFAIKALGEGWCFLANGASFLAVIAGLLAMRDLPPPAKAPARESMWARLHEGFRFAATHEGVRALLLLLALVALAGLPFATLMPIFASKILHGDERTLGYLMGAPGLGAVLVGVVLASRRGASCSASAEPFALWAQSRSLASKSSAGDKRVMSPVRVTSVLR
jgi:Transmembrane secretion effector